MIQEAFGVKGRGNYFFLKEVNDVSSKHCDELDDDVEVTESQRGLAFVCRPGCSYCNTSIQPPECTKSGGSCPYARG